MANAIIENVADTAFMVAAWRAAESERPDALFRDPYAKQLAGERGQRIAKSVHHQFGSWLMGIRTVVIDGFIQAAIADGIETVLNLGAGLDTRPYRMSLPATLRWIEVDRKEILALKEERLASEKPHCKLERVAMDLTDAAARRALLGSLSGKTLVLTEGVVPYLTVEDVAALAEDLRASPTALWIADYISPTAMKFRKKRMGKRFENAQFRFEPPDWSGFFASHGWRVKEMRYLPEEGERLGRPIPMPPLVGLWLKLIRPLVPAARRDVFRKVTAYAVLERADPTP